MESKRRSSTILTVKKDEGGTDAAILSLNPSGVDISGVRLQEENITESINVILQSHYKNKSLTSEIVVVLSKIQNHVTGILDLIKGVLKEN